MICSANHPDMWTPERVAYAKAHNLSAPRVYDCAGIIKSYWMQESPTATAKYIEKYDKSAVGLKACCSTRGPISSIPGSGSLQSPQTLWGDLPGVLVFIGTRHVGVYAGAGKVIEAKGFSYGVVETQLRRGGWDCWGKLDWLDYGDAKPEMPDDCCLEVGDHVRFCADAEKYAPSGAKLPGWVKTGTFTVKQLAYHGQAKMDGGLRCVLLDEVNTWAAIDYLERV